MKAECTVEKRQQVHVVKQGNMVRKPGEYEVEKIIDVRLIDEKEEFLVKWKGFDETENSWEPLVNLNCPRILREFFIQRSLNEEFNVDVPINPDTPYGFERGLAPSYIAAVTQQDGEFFFLMKWKGLNEMDVVPASQANVRCPQIVIGFYESLLHFN